MTGFCGGDDVMEPNERIVQEAKDGDPVALTRVMVGIPSVNPSLEDGGTGEGAMAHQCRRWLTDWGYDVELQEVAEARYNVVGRRFGQRPGRRLILNGHLDTVGVEGMTIPSFHGRLEEGRVWGRGSCDMKGGLAVILAAAQRLSRTGHAGELIVALTADEEHASLGMQHFIALAPDADGAIVCEPTGLAIMPAHKGFLWIDAIFRGKAAHGSRPDEGVDAIRHAARFLTALDEMESRFARGPEHALLGRPSIHAGTIKGGSAPSVYPQECTLVVERRTLPGERPEEILAEFQELLEGVRLERPGLDATVELGLSRVGTEVPDDAPLVRGLAAALEAEGIAPRVEGMTAWVDAAYLNEAGIPAVCFGPGSIAQAHAAEEWVPQKELDVGTRVLHRFSESFLVGGSGGPEEGPKPSSSGV